MSTDHKDQLSGDLVTPTHTLLVGHWNEILFVKDEIALIVIQIQIPNIEIEKISKRAVPVGRRQNNSAL